MSSSDIGHLSVIQSQLLIEEIEQLKKKVRNCNEIQKYHTHIAIKTLM